MLNSINALNELIAEHPILIKANSFSISLRKDSCTILFEYNPVLEHFIKEFGNTINVELKNNWIISLSKFNGITIDITLTQVPIEVLNTYTK